MIKYFKELENRNGQYLDLIDTSRYFYHDITPNYIPLDYFLKHKILFDRIKEYDLLNEKNNKQIKLYTNSENVMENEWEEEYFDFDWMFNYDYASKYSVLADIKGSGLSKYGLEKIYELDYELLINNEEMDMDYFLHILNLLFEDRRVFKITLNHVHEFLNSSYKMAEIQKKLTLQDKVLFKKAFEDLKKYIFQVPKKGFNPVKMYLPNAWYITPYNHLYNIMGKTGHKEANLIYPYYYYIRRDDYVPNPTSYLKSIQKILKDGCIDKITFDHYTNLIYDFTSVYPEEYYYMSNEDKFKYRTMYKKTYNPRIINLIVGIESAHAGLYSFFYNLKNNSLDYKSDLEFLKKYNLDEILVCCCGFHKISSFMDKVITTSCINYDDAFCEYIERGWKIDFVKPIIFNEYTKRVEEYPDDFLTIRRLLKN